MQAGANPFAAKQHHTQKTGLKEKRRQDLVAEQRPQHRAGLVRKDRPVGAKLVGHDNAGYHAHAKDNGEYGLPVVEYPQIHFVPGHEVQAVQNRQIACQPDGECRKRNMRGDRERELHSRQFECIKSEHSLLLVPGRPAFAVQVHNAAARSGRVRHSTNSPASPRSISATVSSTP